MKNLKNKLNKKGGFTLVEMLIVVAIIAILIAISIPLISSALERARVATDAANERSAKAEILITYLAGDLGDTGTTEFKPNTPYYYDAPSGTLVSTPGANMVTYGKCTDHADQYLAVAMDDDGDVYMKWVDTAVADTTISDYTTWNTDLCSSKLAGK